MAKWLALPTLDQKAPDLNPINDKIQGMTVWHFIAQSLSLSPLHKLNITYSQASIFGTMGIYSRRG